VSHYSFGEIDSVPPIPGLYGWFYIAPEFSAIAEDVVLRSSVNVSVSQNFGVMYEGAIQRARSRGVPKLGYGSDVLQTAFLTFTAPLYVGVSENMLARLSVHKRQLLEYLESHDAIMRNRSSVALDTEEESRYFAERIGPSLDGDPKNTMQLVVKCVLCDDEQLRLGVESAINSLVTPLYGRK